MWCNSCQQDVPGIASPNGVTAVGCARCGNELSFEPRPRSDIHFTELENLSTRGQVDRLAAEKLFEAGTASSRLEWERFDWDEDLQHPDLLLNELPETQTVKRQLPLGTQPETLVHSQSPTYKHWTTRGFLQRRIGWCCIAWGLGSAAPSGLWAMWFVSRGDHLWILAVAVAFVSLMVLSFGFVLVLHSQARQVQAIAGILQFFVRQFSELRSDGTGCVERSPYQTSQRSKSEHQNWAA